VFGEFEKKHRKDLKQLDMSQYIRE